MAYQADNTMISNREMLVELITAPFRSMLEFLIRMAEADPRMVALRTLSETSDAELAARGLTRQGVVSSIMGGHAI